MKTKEEVFTPEELNAVYQELSENYESKKSRVKVKPPKFEGQVKGEPLLNPFRDNRLNLTSRKVIPSLRTALWSGQLNFQEAASQLTSYIRPKNHKHGHMSARKLQKLLG